MRNTFYKFYILLACGFLSGTVANAQSDKTAGAPLNLVWDELGPNNLGTKIRTLAFDGSGNLYAGSLGGGLWKSSDQGSSWSQVTSLTANLAVSSIAIDGSNIYVGTGEAQFYKPSGYTAWSPGNISSFDFDNAYFGHATQYGEGVVVSTDGGATWDHDNGTWNASSIPYTGAFRAVQKVAKRSGRTFIATLSGLYYSDDADLTNVTLADGTTPFETIPVTDIEFGSGSTVWAATKDSLYLSTDNGATFGKGINALLPVPTISPILGKLGGSRIEIAIAPSNPSVVYVTGASAATSNSTGVFKSIDNGATWAKVADYENGPFQPFKENGLYSCVLAVDPADENSFFVGGFRLYTYNAADGLLQVGTTTYIPGFSDDYVPNPIHVIAFNPSNANQFFIAGDEEIVRTDDRGATFSFKCKGLNAGHFYSVSAAPNYRIIGAERYHGVTYKATGNPSPVQQQFVRLYDDAIGRAGYFDNNSDWVIAQSSDGGLERSQTNGSTFERFYNTPITPRHPSLDKDSLDDQAFDGASLKDAGGAPITPFVIDDYISPDSLLNDTSIIHSPVWIYMCSRNYVWCITNPMGGIDSVPRWNRLTTKTSMIRLANDPKEYFTAITVSHDGSHTVVVGTNYGKILRILNANDPLNMDITVKQMRLDSGATALPQRWITDLEFDPSNPNNLVVTYGGYDSGDPDRIWICNNAMDPVRSNITFHSVDALPEQVPVFSAAFHPDPSVHALLVGTEIGVFTSTDDWNLGTMLSWNYESDPFGRVPVYDIYIRPYYKLDIDADNYRYAPDHTIFIATHGRGLFKSNTVVAKTPAEGPLDVSIGLYPNPFESQSTIAFTLPQTTKVLVEVYNLTGVRMATLANGEFTGGNHELTLNGSSLDAGVYLVKATFTNDKGAYTKTLKSVVIH